MFTQLAYQTAGAVAFCGTSHFMQHVTFYRDAGIDTGHEQHSSRFCQTKILSTKYSVIIGNLSKNF